MPGKIKLSELARIAAGTLVGDDLDIVGVCDLEFAQSNHITYAVNERYAEELLISKASAAIVPATSKVEFKIPVIRAQNPYWSFAKILEHFIPTPPEPTQAIHPTAVVASSAELGKNVCIEPYAVIGEKVCIGDGSHIGAHAYVSWEAQLGKDCVLHSHVIIRDRCVLGNRVLVQSGSVIGGDGYGFVKHEGQNIKIPQIGIVEIEDDVEIGCNVTIDRATIGKTVIGAGTKVDNLVQIAHNVKLGKNCLLVSQVGLSGSTKVGNDCNFAGQSATTGHLTIGSGTTIAARGVACKDLPSNSFVSGFPARPHRKELKIQACLHSLPDLLKRIRYLEKKLRNQE